MSWNPYWASVLKDNKYQKNKSLIEIILNSKWKINLQLSYFFYVNKTKAPNLRLIIRQISTQLE